MTRKRTKTKLVSVSDVFDSWAEKKNVTISKRTKTKLVSVFDTLRDRGFEPGSVTHWKSDDLARSYHALANSGICSKNLPLACVATEYLAAHQPDTVRGNMYLVVSAGWLPDTGMKSYGQIQRLLNKLREKRIIPFSWITDTVRASIKPSSWSGLADFADTVRDCYRKDYWATLPDYVEVIVEKDTVAGRISVVTEEFDVPLHPIRGYSSTSYAWSIARGWRDIAKPITIYYVGDHDPSGRDLERNIREKLARYSECEFAWVRLGVNPEHFDEYNIIPLAVKKKDRRARGFVEKWGEKCSEVEAIPATALRQIVRDAIESHIPAGSWDRLQTIEEVERESWKNSMGQFAKEIT